MDKYKWNINDEIKQRKIFFNAYLLKGNKWIKRKSKNLKKLVM